MPGASYPSGDAATNSIPSAAHICESDTQTLFPSPSHATRTPSKPPSRSRIVIASASAWHGCVSSVSPLTTGIRACSASSSTSDCANVRTIIASRYPERT